MSKLAEHKDAWSNSALERVLKRAPERKKTVPDQLGHRCGETLHPGSSRRRQRRSRIRLHGQARLSWRLSLHARCATDHVSWPAMDPCGSTPVLAPRLKAIDATSICWITDRPGSVSHSIYQRR